MNEPANPLNSWKEIAAYLGVTPRTAQTWEKNRGLPVTRIPGGRGTVMADRTALDAWRSKPEAERQATEKPARSRSRSLALVGLVLLPIILAVAVTLAWWPFDSRPAAYRITGQTVTILDRRGRDLWSQTEVAPERYWRDTALWESVPVQIRDIDGDGVDEVLISYGYAVSPQSGSLVCYSSGGEERWRFRAGGKVRTHDAEFGNPFAIRSFAISSSVPAKIALSSTHRTEFPSQVVLLSHLGELEGEYWHSGWLVNLRFLDLDGDGAEELYAGGVSNASNRATVVVLDPGNMRGASAEPADFQFLGMETNRERLRAFFPRTCLNKKRRPRNFVQRVTLVEEGLSVLTAELLGLDLLEGVYHLLTPEFETIRTIPEGHLEVVHQRAFESGELNHKFSKAELSELGVIEVVRPSQ